MAGLRMTAAGNQSGAFIVMTPSLPCAWCGCQRLIIHLPASCVGSCFNMWVCFHDARSVYFLLQSVLCPRVIMCFWCSAVLSLIKTASSEVPIMTADEVGGIVALKSHLERARNMGCAELSSGTDPVALVLMYTPCRRHTWLTITATACFRACLCPSRVLGEFGIVSVHSRKSSTVQCP
jgi:hypothetical protein